MWALCDGSGVGTFGPVAVLALGDVVVRARDGTDAVAALPDEALEVELPQATTIRATAARRTTTSHLVFTLPSSPPFPKLGNREPRRRGWQEPLRPNESRYVGDTGGSARSCDCLAGRRSIDTRPDRAVVPGSVVRLATEGIVATSSPLNQPCENGSVDVIPVRRDGTGRLVAVGLIEVADTDGEQRWTTIHRAELAGETIDEAIERSLSEALGPDAHGQRSKPRSMGTMGSRLAGRGDGAGRGGDRREIDDPCAVEIWGKLQPQGVARRFTWFIVTALPAQREIASGMRPVLASFLEAQGEPGLAARLRQF